MNSSSTPKHYRLSLASQVNILIVAITLGISLLLMAISAFNYREAIVEPRTRRLAELELKDENYRPYLEYFAQLFGTEEMVKARDSHLTEENDYYLDWMNETPSFQKEENVFYRENLFFDIVAFDLNVTETLDSIDLDSVCVEIEKDGTCYLVCQAEKNNDSRNLLEEFGWEERFIDGQKENFQSPTLLKVGSDYSLLRCVTIDLDGAEGRVWLIYSMTGRFQELNRFVMRNVGYILVLTTLVSLLSVALLRRYVTKPISALAQSATEFTPQEDGSYSTESISTVEIAADNELGDLSREIQAMQTRIVENAESMRSMMADKQRIITELNLASRIQESMLPSEFPPFPDRTEFGLYASMTPAMDVGGDFYDFFLVDEDHLALVMADVSGKGVPGALLMMVSKVVLKNNAMMGKPVGEIMKMTNNLFSANNRAEMFVTVWMGILEISTGKITAVNAGHEYPALTRDGRFELYKDRHSFVIGAMEGVNYSEYELQLNPGDRLFLYTDGVPEATDTQEQMFGTERMIDALNACADGSPEEILACMKRSVDDFVGDAEPFDDLTMLCLEYLGPPEAKPDH